MDEQAQQRLNEAADKFTNALVESYRAVSERGVAAQEAGAQLTQDFFNRVIDNLRSQAEDTREMSGRLADQQQRAQEAARDLTQASTDAYMDFLNSVSSFYQASVEAAQRGAREAGQSTTGAAAPAAESQAGADLPLADYDSLNVNEVTARMEELSVEELEQLRDYEARNKNRQTLMGRFDQRIEAGSPS